MTRMQQMRYAAVLFAAGSVVHNADHFRRGLDSVTVQLQVAGWLAMAISALAIVAVLVGHQQAPVIAASAGFGLAVGFAAAHWLPTWSVLSDSFVEGGASGLSQFASALEIVGALALGIAGLRVMLAEGVSPARGSHA